MRKAIRETGIAAAEIDDALAVIRDSEWPAQRASMEALAEMRSPDGDRALLRLLDHRSASVREAAMNALQDRDPATARLAARSLLSDENSCARSAAASALAFVGTRLDTRRLIDALEHDKNWVVRASAADSLGVVAKKAALPALWRAVRGDAHPVVRRDAAFAISYANDPSVVPDLEQAVDAETEEQARIGLLNALYAVGQRERLAQALDLLHSADDCVRHVVVNTVPDIARPEDHAAVFEAFAAALPAEQNAGVKGDMESQVIKLAGFVGAGFDDMVLVNMG